MRTLTWIVLALVMCSCGEEEETAAAEADEAVAAESTTSKSAPVPSLNLQAVVDTKIYGFRKVPERTKVVASAAVGTYVSAKKGKAGSHIRLELTVSSCAGCTPTAEEKTWELKMKHLLAAKRKLDESAVLEFEKVGWKGSQGVGTYTLLFNTTKRSRDKSYQAEHAYAARFTDGRNLIELKASPCDEKGHPFAKSRGVLAKSATKKELKKTVRRAWAKFKKHFPALGS